MVTSHRYCTTCGAANQIQDAFCFACGHPLQAITPSPQYPVAGSATRTATGLLTPNLLLKQRYRILSPLGKGGFGAVYKTEDIQLGNRLLAVKEMSQNGLNPQEIAEAAENFKGEALLLAALKHPNLPSIYDHFNEAGRWYLVMDFIEGETLEAHLTKKPEGHLSMEATFQISIQLCTVLSYLHCRQPPIIFRDLKPANIMLTPEGHLYLIDFGIARHFKPGQAKDTIAFGSPGYAAPEQYGKAQTTALSDIYSLGATLHQLLTGIDPSHTPFQFVPLQLHGQALPPGLEALLMQMLEMNESKRPASMIVVKQELQRIFTQQPASQVTIPQPSALAQPAAPISSPSQQAQTSTPGAHPQISTPKVAGSLHLKAKRFQEALAAFEQAIQLDPDDASIYNGKGLTLSELKRYQEALAAFEQAIGLNPYFANAYINKGMMLNQLKRYQEALPAFERAIQLEPTNASAYNLKGLMLTNLKRYAEALATYEQAIQFDPQLAVAHNNRGLTLSNLQRYAEALAAYEQVIRLNPSLTIVYTNKVVALITLKRYGEALATVEQGIQLDPKNAALHNFKGNALLALNRYGEALAAFEHAIRLDPKFAIAFSNRGLVLCHLNRHREALTACERAIRLDLNLAVAYSNKSVALCGLKRYGEAVGACEQAIQLDPNLGGAFHSKGIALQSLGRIQEAQQAFQRARQLGFSR